MNTKYKIGFVGPYSTANFGDYAMLVNNLYDIGCQDTFVFTYNSRFPKVSLDEYCSEINIKYVEVKLGDYMGILKSGDINKVFRYTPLEVLTMIDNPKEVYDAIEGIDILIVSGGGWINHFWAYRLNKLFKMMIPIYVASQKQKKIIFTANGIGPFDESRELYRYFFGYVKNAKIAIRDNICSPSHLLEVGVESKDVHFLPDDLYLINPKLLNKKTHGYVRQSNYIVIEMYYPLDELKKYEHRLAHFSKTIHDKYGLSIVLLPFDLVQYGSDQAKYLHSIFEKSELFNIDEIGYLPIQDAYKIIKNAKMMITSRYHGLVLSLSAETPVICRLYDIMGDLRYSYNKGFGILREVFDEVEFNEKDFLQSDLMNILTQVEESFEDITSRQNRIYSSKKYKENKLKLKKLRTNYIGDICN